MASWSSTAAGVARYDWGMRKPKRDWVWAALPPALLFFALGAGIEGYRLSIDAKSTDIKSKTEASVARIQNREDEARIAERGSSGDSIRILSITSYITSFLFTVAAIVLLFVPSSHALLGKRRRRKQRGNANPIPLYRRDEDDPL